MIGLWLRPHWLDIISIILSMSFGIIENPTLVIAKFFFGCKCFILSTKDNLDKFDPKFDVGIFLGYSNTSESYGVYNKITLIVEEFIHVIFD